MSNIINKIKDAVHGDKAHEAPQGSHGPHSTATGNTLDPRVDSDRDHRANPTSNVGGTGAYSGTHTGAGYDNTGLGSSQEAPQGAHGPHGSKIANTLDPRVDSDRDHRANPTSNVGGTGAYSSGTHTGTHTGTGGYDGAGYGSAQEAPQGAHGPHGSKIANTLDPRVDSDRDHRANPASNVGGTGAYTSGTHTGSHTGAGYGSNEAPQGTHGPHGSKIANTLDPRVDSDRDHRANPTSNVGGSSTTGAYGSSGHTTGTHGTGAHTGPGPAPSTAGPHKSDLLNKVDPRVDSDLDGSKTVGGNKTYTSSNTTRDPTDASQVPPSVLRQHIGDPTIHHDDHGHNRERRNSTATHQETHRGI